MFQSLVWGWPATKWSLPNHILTLWTEPESFTRISRRMSAVAQPRPFNPDALKPYAVPWLIPNVSNWSAVWRYTVLVPVEQIQADGTASRVAADNDIENLELMFIEHFGGITRPERRFGRGAHDPKRPK